MRAARGDADVLQEVFEGVGMGTPRQNQAFASTAGTHAQGCGKPGTVS